MHNSSVRVNNRGFSIHVLQHMYRDSVEYRYDVSSFYSVNIYKFHLYKYEGRVCILTTMVIIIEVVSHNNSRTWIQKGYILIGQKLDQRVILRVGVEQQRDLLLLLFDDNKVKRVRK